MAFSLGLNEFIDKKAKLNQKANALSDPKPSRFDSFSFLFGLIMHDFAVKIEDKHIERISQKLLLEE